MLWDQISSEVAQTSRDNPGTLFSIPNEIPDPD